MPRKKDDTSDSLPCAVIYGEDLEEILTTVQSVCGKVVLLSDKTEFDSLQELREHSGNKLTQLEIKGTGSSSDKPYRSLSIDFSSYSVYMSRSAGDAETKAAWYYLRDLIRKRRRKFNYIFNADFWVYSIFIMFAVLLVFANLQIRVPLWLWGMAAAVFVFFTVSIWSPSSGSVIHLNRRHTVSTFWGRNRDELIKLMIAALIGAAITLFLQFLTKLNR